MFHQLYLKNWQRIVNTYPKGTLRYRRAACILKAHAITIKRHKEPTRGEYLWNALLLMKP